LLALLVDPLDWRRVVLTATCFDVAMLVICYVPISFSLLSPSNYKDILTE